jgi:hypothetical protein
VKGNNKGFSGMRRQLIIINNKGKGIIIIISASLGTHKSGY